VTVKVQSKVNQFEIRAFAAGVAQDGLDHGHATSGHLRLALASAVKRAGHKSTHRLSGAGGRAGGGDTEPGRKRNISGFSELSSIFDIGSISSLFLAVNVAQWLYGEKNSKIRRAAIQLPAVLRRGAGWQAADPVSAWRPVRGVGTLSSTVGGRRARDFVAASEGATLAAFCVGGVFGREPGCGAALGNRPTEAKRLGSATDLVAELTRETPGEVDQRTGFNCLGQS